MSVECTLEITFAATETLELNVPAASAGGPVVHDSFTKSLSLNGDSTPPVDEVAYMTLTLSAGAYSLDLTALPGVNGRTIDATGKRVLAFYVEPQGNNDVAFGDGASNGYAIFGADAPTFKPGSGVGGYLGVGMPTISGTEKTIDFAGTGADQIKLGLWLG